ncbi:MAG: alpha/beta fold hydrolase, partial [Chloroflexi bacterium]|nr:alpha/beta fold hydrolase [Chloroflexota bacterium]
MSIYRSAAGEAIILAMYDRQVAALGTVDERVVETRFGPTHVLITGPQDAPPLVLLHGSHATAPYSLRTVLPLADHYRVYAPDIMGHPGRSASKFLPPRDLSYGRWIGDVLEALRLGAVPVVGLSFGAGVILRLAAYAPEAITAAALVVPAGVISPPMFPMIARMALPMLAYRRLPTRERLLRVVRLLADPVKEEHLGMVGAIFDHVKLEPGWPRPATRRELVDLTAPVLVLAADQDVYFPAARVIPRVLWLFQHLAAAEVITNCT